MSLDHAILFIGDTRRIGRGFHSSRWSVPFRFVIVQSSDRRLSSLARNAHGAEHCRDNTVHLRDSHWSDISFVESGRHTFNVTQIPARTHARKSSALFFITSACPTLSARKQVGSTIDAYQGANDEQSDHGPACPVGTDAIQIGRTDLNRCERVNTVCSCRFYASSMPRSVRLNANEPWPTTSFKWYVEMSPVP